MNDSYPEFIQPTIQTSDINAQDYSVKTDSSMKSIVNASIAKAKSDRLIEQWHELNTKTVKHLFDSDTVKLHEDLESLDRIYSMTEMLLPSVPKYGIRDKDKLDLHTSLNDRLHNMDNVRIKIVQKLTD